MPKTLAVSVHCKGGAPPPPPPPPPPPCLAYVIDYGRELQGGVNITFPFVDTDGHAVQVLLSEELKKDGTPLVPMRTGNDFADTWTLKASTAPQTVAQHEYMEFRYAMIVNTPGKLRLADVNGWVIRYPLSDALDDMYGDVPALKPTVLRRPAALATFSSNLAPLNAVWIGTSSLTVATTHGVHIVAGQYGQQHSAARLLCHGRLHYRHRPTCHLKRLWSAKHDNAGMW